MMARQELGEEGLVERLSSLSPEGRLAFAASCCERMMPNFEAFALAEGIEDSKACSQALEMVWQCVAGQRALAEEIGALRTRCNEVVAEPENYGSMWVGLATNAVSALMDALDCCLNASPQSAANTAVLAGDSVEEYISRVDKPLTSSQVQERGVGFDRWIMEHPLKGEEVEKQRADLELLASCDGMTPDIIRDLRRSARSYGVQPFRRGLIRR